MTVTGKLIVSLVMAFIATALISFLQDGGLGLPLLAVIIFAATAATAAVGARGQPLDVDGHALEELGPGAGDAVVGVHVVAHLAVHVAHRPGDPHRRGLAAALGQRAAVDLDDRRPYELERELEATRGDLEGAERGLESTRTELGRSLAQLESMRRWSEDGLDDAHSAEAAARGRPAWRLGGPLGDAPRR